MFKEGIAMSKKKNHFFAMLSRMKYINRWALMRNTHDENISEHSLEVATVAHALAVDEPVLAFMVPAGHAVRPPDVSY